MSQILDFYFVYFICYKSLTCNFPVMKAYNNCRRFREIFTFETKDKKKSIFLKRPLNLTNVKIVFRGLDFVVLKW